MLVKGTSNKFRGMEEILVKPPLEIAGVKEPREERQKLLDRNIQSVYLFLNRNALPGIFIGFYP